MKINKPEGMTAFTMVWLGQVVSLIGSAMSHFAVGIWAWEKTGQATPMAMIGFFGFLPLILITPIAGVLVDRWNRKLVMALSDTATGLTTIVMLILALTNTMQIWHLYILAAFNGIFGSFQWPAYSAAISLMIPKKQYTRASGMISLAETGSGILAPVLAGMLIGRIGIEGVFIVDIITLVFALFMLLLVKIPSVDRSQAEETGRGNFWHELEYGFHYLFSRASLLSLQLVYFFGNFFASIAYALIAPMILARTSGNATTLGSVQSVGAIGGVIGSLILTAWGGPKRRILGVLLGWIGTGLLGVALFGATWFIPVWMAANFLGNAIPPILNGSNQAIWQSKVAPDVQGRVFSVRRLVAQITSPLSLLIAGPLADKVMEPAMQDQSTAISRVLGPVFGTGPGAGMSIIIVACGLLMALVGLMSFNFSKVRNVETLLPDHDAGQEQIEPVKP